MPQAKTLNCPSCGASLSIEGKTSETKCSYCGTNVIIPKELREQPTQNVIIQVGEPQYESRWAALPPASRAWRIFASALLLAITVSAVGWVILTKVNPKLSKQIVNQVPTGFARETLTFGGDGTGPGLFQDARHVAVDGNGNVYVSDDKTVRIQKFDSSGKYVSGWVIGDESGPMTTKSGPSKLAADNAGNVYVLFQGAVLKYEGASGKFLARLTGEMVNASLKVSDEFKNIAITPDNNLLVISNAYFSDDLVRMDPNGKITSRVKKIVATPMDEPVVVGTGLEFAVDGLGNIFILYEKPSESTILKYTPAGKYVSRFGSKGDKPGQLNGIAKHIAVDNTSRVYVGDFKGIQVFDANGQFVATIANAVYGNVAFDFAMSSKNELYVVGDKGIIHKLVLNESK